MTLEAPAGSNGPVEVSLRNADQHAAAADQIGARQRR